MPISFSQLGSSCFSTTSSSRTSPSGVKHARPNEFQCWGPPLRRETLFLAWKRERHVRSAARKPPFRSSQRKDARCSAANVSSRNGLQPRLEKSTEPIGHTQRFKNRRANSFLPPSRFQPEFSTPGCVCRRLLLWHGANGCLKHRVAKTFVVSH